MEKICGIYKFTNKLSEKVYIGKSVDINRRIKGHLKESKNNPTTPFHKALNKYGLNGFDFEILIECSPDDLNYWEQYYINYYKSNIYIYGDKYGYNCTKGGDGVQLFGDKNGMYGKHHTPEAVEKCRICNVGRSWTDEQRKKYEIYCKTHDGPMKGKHHTEEANEKNRQAHLGKITSEETKEKQREKSLAWYATHEAPTKGKPSWNSGREQKSHMTEESIEACREAGRTSGSMVWIYRGDEKPRRCFKEELDYYCNVLGYKRGRRNWHPANYIEKVA